MEELWQKVEGFPMYEVSNHGRIRNVKTGRILKTSINDKGYEVVCLSNGGNKQFLKKIHILVGEAFCEKYYDDLKVTHADGNKLHNHADNLEWRRWSDIKRRSCRQRPVLQPNRRKRILVIETGEIFDSIVEASRALGLSESTISKCLNYKFYRNRKGYNFEEIL